MPQLTHVLHKIVYSLKSSRTTHAKKIFLLSKEIRFVVGEKEKFLFVLLQACWMSFFPESYIF